MYEYNAKIISVYDGDTVTAEVDLGFNVTITEKFRLVRINAPEVRGEEREDGLKSRDRLRELILNKSVVIKTLKDRKGKFGRYLAEIYINEDDNSTNVNDWLVTENLAEYKDY
jgi:micrococcal nuclease